MTIREIRNITGLSQGKFGEKYGIPIRTIQDWEAGRRVPPEYVVKLLAKCVKIDEEAKDMENERYIKILEAAGYTHKEAKKEFDRGQGMRPEIWEDLNEFANVFETSADAIRAGEVEDLKTVTVDGIEYGIQIVH